MAEPTPAKTVTVSLQALKLAFLAHVRDRAPHPLTATEERVEWEAFWHRLGGAVAFEPTPVSPTAKRGAGW